MDNVVYKEKIFSFIDLLKEHRIEIPIIQRDYAQGRAENTDIRQNFLTALKDSLATNTNIQLDFIYGNRNEEVFQPLDGQQRLTTLFLLHWYAATKNHIDDKNIRELLSRFSYETRISSREFCQALVNNPLKICIDDVELSAKIIDSNWFFLFWKKDPTIHSMLNTIDDIHQLFSDINNLWERLTADNLISFYYVELENIGLTDDLYIRMNARGKLLLHLRTLKQDFRSFLLIINGSVLKTI